MDIVVGTISGLIASVIIFIVGLIFTKIVIPWYQELIYKGVELKGNWTNEKETNGIKYQYHMILEQKAHNLSGTMTLTKSGTPDGKDYVQPFTISGTTWEGFVTLNYISKDKRSLSFATSLVTINNLGNNLKGYLVHRSRDNNEVKSEEIAWIRAK